jgi:hypothetical protein
MDKEKEEIRFQNTSALNISNSIYYWEKERIDLHAPLPPYALMMRN